MANELYEKADQSMPTELSGMWLDLVIHGLQEIDWHDVADDLFKSAGAKGYEPLKERE
jgi:hypothetical protein